MNEVNLLDWYLEKIQRINNEVYIGIFFIFTVFVFDISPPISNQFSIHLNMDGCLASLVLLHFIIIPLSLIYLIRILRESTSIKVRRNEISHFIKFIIEPTAEKNLLSSGTVVRRKRLIYVSFVSVFCSLAIPIMYWNFGEYLRNCSSSQNGDPFAYFISLAWLFYSFLVMRAPVFIALVINIISKRG